MGVGASMVVCGIYEDRLYNPKCCPHVELEPIVIVLQTFAHLHVAYTQTSGKRLKSDILICFYWCTVVNFWGTIIWKCIHFGKNKQSHTCTSN